MRTRLIVVLAVIVLAGWLGTLIARDPGYVMVAYGDLRLQTSLWVGLALFTALVFFFYYGFRMLRGLLGTGALFRGWQDDRRKAKAHDRTMQGFRLLMEGQYARAEKFLVAGAAYNNAPAVNYIAAAQAADHQDKHEAREHYLRSAGDADPSIEPTAAMAAAEMRAARGEWRECMRCLDGLADDAKTVPLRAGALRALEDWQGLQAFLPALRKFNPGAEVQAAEKSIFLGQLDSHDGDDELKAAFRKLSTGSRSDPDVVLAYARRLLDDAEVESALRSALKANWSPALLARYGDATLGTLDRRIKQAEGWQKKHTDDAVLQLCLGKLYRAKGERDKAKNALEKSTGLVPSPEANAELAGLLAFDGDYAGSNEKLRSALQLRES